MKGSPMKYYNYENIVQKHQTRKDLDRSVAKAYKEADSIQEFEVKASLLCAGFFMKWKYIIYFYLKNYSNVFSSFNIVISTMVVGILTCLSIEWSTGRNVVAQYIFASLCGAIVGCFLGGVVSIAILSFKDKMHDFINNID